MKALKFIFLLQLGFACMAAEEVKKDLDNQIPIKKEQNQTNKKHVEIKATGGTINLIPIEGDSNEIRYGESKDSTTNKAEEGKQLSVAEGEVLYIRCPKGTTVKVNNIAQELKIKSDVAVDLKILFSKVKGVATVSGKFDSIDASCKIDIGQALELSEVNCTKTIKINKIQAIFEKVRSNSVIVNRCNCTIDDLKAEKVNISEAGRIQVKEVSCDSIMMKSGSIAAEDIKAVSFNIKSGSIDIHNVVAEIMTVKGGGRLKNIKVKTLNIDHWASGSIKILDCKSANIEMASGSLSGDFEQLTLQIASGRLNLNIQKKCRIQSSSCSGNLHAKKGANVDIRGHNHLVVTKEQGPLVHKSWF